MNIYKLFPSKYVKAHDLSGPVTVVMDRLTIESMGQPPEEKPVLWFRGATKGLVLNKTNATTVAHLYGPETDTWAGKRIRLYPTRVKAFGGMHDVIRVADEKPSGASPQQEATPAGLVDDSELVDFDEVAELAPAPDDDANPFVPEQPTGTEATQANPVRNRFHAVLNDIFGGMDVNAGRHLVVERWTHSHTPQNLRSSSKELTNDEMDVIADELSNMKPTGVKQLRALLQGRITKASPPAEA